MLELTDNGATLVLRLSATVLAIITPCSPTEVRAHNSCRRQNRLEVSHFSGFGLEQRNRLGEPVELAHHQGVAKGSASSRTRASLGQLALRSRYSQIGYPLHSSEWGGQSA